MTTAERVANLIHDAEEIETNEVRKLEEANRTIKRMGGMLAETLAILDKTLKRVAVLEAREREGFMDGVPAIGETFRCALCQTVHGGEDPCAWVGCEHPRAWQADELAERATSKAWFRCAGCDTKTDQDALCAPCASKLIGGPVMVR